MKPILPCAIYTRKSSEDGLEQDFNSLHAQRDACLAYIQSQKGEGWKAIPDTYDDGGYSGGNMERPGLSRLMQDIARGRVRIVVVYKVDRLTRSLADFAKLVEQFDAKGVSFVSVTQQFNTTSSMGRLTLNVLLSFAQFEREVTGERIRDKIAASKKKGMWMGGTPPVGYLAKDRTLVIDEPQADRIREIYRRYLTIGCVRKLKHALDTQGWVTPRRTSRRQNASGGRPYSRGHLYRILSNPIYRGKIPHKDEIHPGMHPAIIDQDLWDQVQEALAANRQGDRTRSRASSPGLLAGLLTDPEGHRYSTVHATKGTRRYRYYVLSDGEGTDRHDVKNTDKRSRACPKTLRWPAQELEATVLETLITGLKDPAALLDALTQDQPEDAQTGIDVPDAVTIQHTQHEARRLALRLEQGTASQRIEVLQRIVDAVRLDAERVQIAVRLQPMMGREGETERIAGHETTGGQGKRLHLERPITLKRCGMAVRLIVRAPGAQPSRQDPKLIALLAKAAEWRDRLITGTANGVLAIAKAEGVDSSYVTRIINLGCLAPDLVERFLDGMQPPAMSAASLLKHMPLPMAWEAQRQLLGMANSD